MRTSTDTSRATGAVFADEGAKRVVEVDSPSSAENKAVIVRQEFAATATLITCSILVCQNLAVQFGLSNFAYISVLEIGH